MPDITQLKKKYLVQNDDANPPSQPTPTTFGNCKVTPLIDGKAYFSDLNNELSSLGTGSDASEHFLYMAGWIFDLLGLYEVELGSGGSRGPTGRTGAPFALDSLGGSDVLLDILKQKAGAGVDVRVLGNIFWALVGTPGGWIARHVAPGSTGAWTRVNLGTLRAIEELRKAQSLETKCCLNTLSHTIGSAHAKLVVVRNANGIYAYTGGIDFDAARHADTTHSGDQNWHDIQVKLEGPGVQALYDLFQALWNEQIGRTPMTFAVGQREIPDVVAGTPTVPDRTLPAPNVGSHHVQSHRTIPQFNYADFNIFPQRQAISFAPQGRFEIQNAWQKAIGSAEKYVYIENYEFSSHELMGWLNQRLKNAPNLKIILLQGTRLPDPPQLSKWDVQAIKEALLKGLNTSQKGRIAIYGRNDAYIHSKTILVDDIWTFIGSPNCSTRSFYTDIEHGIGVIDEAGNLLPQYRGALWGEHFGLAPNNRSNVQNLDQALNVWDGSWGRSGLGVSNPPLKRFTISALEATSINISGLQQQIHDTYWAPDSREKWGGCPL